MNYKIPKNILLASIFICFISSILTARQILIIQNKRESINGFNLEWTLIPNSKITEKEYISYLNNKESLPFPLPEPKKKSSIFSLYLKSSIFFLYLLLFFLIVIDFYLIYLLFNNDSQLAKNAKNEIQKYSKQLLPEEYINDLETIRKRLQKQKLSDEEIETEITLSALGMLRGYLICKLQDLWLNKNRPE